MITFKGKHKEEDFTLKNLRCSFFVCVITPNLPTIINQLILIKDVHLGQIFLRLFELIILVVTITIP